jgi:hypothetical protein
VQHGTMPDGMKDTVGAVVYHHADGMAAGVSRSSEQLQLNRYLGAYFRMTVAEFF